MWTRGELSELAKRVLLGTYKPHLQTTPINYLLYCRDLAKCTNLSRDWKEAITLLSSLNTKKTFLEFLHLLNLFRPKTFAEVRKTES